MAALKLTSALLEQRKKLVEALVPALPEGSKGTIALTGLPFECKLLAYRQINRAAAAISGRVAKQRPKRVLIHDVATLPSLAGYHAFAKTLDRVIDLVTKEIELADKVLAGRRDPEPPKEKPSETLETLDVGIAGIV